MLEITYSWMSIAQKMYYIKTVNAQQAKSVYHFKNTMQKLLNSVNGYTHADCDFPTRNHAIIICDRH
jgi:hypothetical protein